MFGLERLFISIVMPALNEERYIASAIASLLPGEDAPFDYELLVVDGGSRDATRDIVRLLARGNPTIRLLDNDRRIQSAGMNIAARMADGRSTVLVRADCHAAYPAGFVERCVAALASTGAGSVVVPMRTVGRSCMQRGIAAAQNSRLGNGGSAHRMATSRSGFVDHGHHAAFDRQAFLDLGGYDESFPSNEDAEYDRRLAKTGRRIWLEADATITYFPRADLASLARQYFGYGAGRARTAVKQRMPLRPRQALPVAILAACAVTTLLAVLDPRWLLADALYAGLCLGWGLVLAMRAASPCLLPSGLAAMVMHLAWGAGFIRGWLALNGRAGRSATSEAALLSGGRD